MATPSERNEMISSMKKLPARLETAVQGLSDEQLSTPGGEGEWSIRQNVHHLADAQAYLVIRIKHTLTEQNPSFNAFHQDMWASFPDNASAPLAPSLGILRGLHERLGILLESVPETAWERTGVHPQRGVMTLEDLLAAIVRHGEAHLAQIAGVKASKGW